MSNIRDLYNEGFYDDDEAEKESIRQYLERQNEIESLSTFSSPSDSAELEKKFRSYADAATQKVEKVAADSDPEDGFNSLFMDSLRHASETINQRIPELVDAYKKADLSTDEGIKNSLRLLGANPATGIATSFYLQYFGGDPEKDAGAKEKFEAITGQKYYTKDEIDELAMSKPEQADVVRSRQGSSLRKVFHGLKNIYQGVVGVLDNHVQNISTHTVTDPETGERKKIAGIEGAYEKMKDDPLDFYGDAALSALDSLAMLRTPLGMVGIAADFATDASNLMLTDPVAFVAMGKAGKSSGPQLAAAARGLRQGGIKGARAAVKMKKIEQQTANKSPAEYLEKAFMRAEEGGGVKGKIASTMLDLQRGGGPKEGILSTPFSILSSVTSTGLPYIFSKNSLVGLPEWAKKRIVDADSEVKAKRNQFKDDLLNLARSDKVDVFAVMREMAQKNQTIMPETFSVISEVSKILSDSQKRSKRLNERLSDTKLSEAQKVNLQRTIEANRRITSDLTSALDNLDYAKVDSIRNSLLKDWFKKNRKNFKFDRLKNKDNWENAAQNAIKNTPNSFMNITYDGAAVHPLTFMMSPERAKNFDPKKLSVEVNTPANATPEAVAYLTGYQAEVASLIKLSAMQALEMANLKDNRGRPLISREAAIMNSLAGYFPEGKALKAFDKIETKRKGELDTVYDVVENHLELARKKRDPSHGSVRTLEEAVEYAKNDAEAYQLFTQTLLANFETIERSKMWRDLEAGLIAEGKVFDTVPQGAKEPYILASPKGGIEFGPLANKYIPRRIYENIIRFDRDYKGYQKLLQEFNAIFKVGKTSLSMPYYMNTVSGLALGQTLFGGNPLSVLTGLRSYINKDKYYRAMRDAGQIVSADEIIGLESVSTRSRIRKIFNTMGRAAFEKGKNGEFTNQSTKTLATFMEKFSDSFDSPKNATSRNIRTAALASGFGAGLYWLRSGTLTGAALGGVTGFLLARSKHLSGMFDQGSRVASFKRRINEMASDLSSKQGIPKERAVDLLLRNQDARRNAAQFALDTNLDYQYVPFGVEKISTWPGPFPFIKFAYKSAGAQLAYPMNEAGRYIQLTEAQKAYMRTLPDEDKIVLSQLPMQFQGAAIRMGQDMVQNLAFQHPLVPGSILETLAPATAVFGGGGVPYDEGEILETAGQIAARDSLTRSGWVEALSMLFRDRDRYGKEINDSPMGIDRVAAMMQSLLPNSVQYNERLKMAKETKDGIDFSGMNEEQLFNAAVGVKLRGSPEVIQRNLEKIRKAYDRTERKIEKDFEKEIDRISNLKDIEEQGRLEEKAYKKMREDKIALEKALYAIEPGASLSVYQKLFGGVGGLLE